MDVLITYDVSAKQPEVKAGMKARGYSDAWNSSNVKYSLPDTTLWKKDLVGPQAALQDLQSVVASLTNVRLERAIATPCDQWSGIPGDSHGAV